MALKKRRYEGLREGVDWKSSLGKGTVKRASGPGKKQRPGK